MAAHLLVLGDRAGVAWVLEKQRMAFPGYRQREVSALKSGDSLLLYTTRGAYHNPGRDRGRVIGLAVALTAPERLDDPVTVAGRTFDIGCDIEVKALAPLGAGIELAPLIDDLSTFSNKVGWAPRLRRPLVTLTASDAKLLLRELKPNTAHLGTAVDSYVSAADPHLSCQQ